MAKEKTLISIDAGMSTGLIVGTYSDTEPFRVTHAFQIEGGVEGFLKDLRVRDDLSTEYPRVYVRDVCISDDKVVEVIAEKFTARGSANAGFSYKTDSLEPLRVEGAILALGINPIWVSPQLQYFLGGESKAEKLKNRNAWFREHKDLGYYLTGKTVRCKDANDARSALAHCISFLRREKHPPTLSLFRRE